MSEIAGDADFPVDSSNVRGLEEIEAIEETELQLMTKGLVTQRLTHLKERITNEIEDLKERQKRIYLMHGMQRAINKPNDEATDEEGGLNLTKSPEIQEYRQKAKELLLQADHLELEAQDLEKQGKKGEAKAKRDAALECRDVARAMGAEWNKEILTKEEKDRLLENLRMTCDDVNTFIQLQTQTTNRLHNELHESLLLGRDIMKRIHEVLSLMAKGIRGG